MRIKKNFVFISIFLILVVSKVNAASISLNQSKATGLVENYYQVDRDGRYIMRYETTAGVVHYETGYLRRTADGTPYQVKEGYYIYPTPDGKIVRLAYFADHEGYRVLSYDIRVDAFEEDQFYNLVAEMESGKEGVSDAAEDNTEEEANF